MEGENTDKTQLRQQWEDIVRSLIRSYLEVEAAGKDIPDINPWRVLEDNRLRVAQEALNNNYPTTIEAQTAALLIIEKELHEKFGDQYLEYCKNNQIENRLEALIYKEAKRVVDDLTRAKGRGGTDKQALYKVWLEMIAKYQNWLSCKLTRNQDGISQVVTRPPAELTRFIDRAFADLS